MAETPRTWFVLLHTRGPAIGEGQSVFEHPEISEHYAFLQRRVAAGELVAAGPLPDEPGSGMTVLAVADLDTATRLATEDDQAVVGRVLQVRVRPWQVVMARGD
jgi:uncharacterized protein YciI